MAAIRAEPDDEAEQVTQALFGEPLLVEETRGGWARIRTAYDYPGWLRAEALAEGEGELVRDASGSPVDVARSYLGAPYLWGGLTEDGIDCSGLVHMAHRRLGRLIPRDADQQEEAGSRSTTRRQAISSRTATRLQTTSRSGSATVASCTRPAATTASA